MQMTKHSGCCQALVFMALSCLLPPVAESGFENAASAREYHHGSAYQSRFQWLLDRAVSGGLVGASSHVSGPGFEFNGAAGLANIVSGEPMTPGHAMYMASLGKPFTAALALQLCDEGVLDLDSPVSHWLPHDLAGRIPSSETITLRHLLNHTSGLIDYMNDQKAWRSDFVHDPYKRWTHANVIPYIYDKPLRFRPGSDFDYSNSNYILVGLIIERVTGRPLHTLMQQRIIEPLGMRNTFADGAADRGEELAHGYISRRGRIIDTYPWYRGFALADSAVHSTPADLALFMRELLTSDRILTRAMRGEMLQVSNAGQPPSDYGLGIYVQRNPWGAGKLWYAHDGIDPGYQADMLYLPEYDLVIVLAANASMGRANRAYQSLITAIVDTVLGSLD